MSLKQEAPSSLYSCTCVRKFLSDMEKTYSFHSVIIPANHVVTIECFINEGCTTEKAVIFLCVLYSMNINIKTRVVGDGVVTLQ